MKHFLKRSVSALLVLVLLVSALSGLAFAADDAYLSLRAEKTGDKEVTVTVTTLKRLENIGSIDAVFTVPAGFTLKQDSMTSDLSNYGTFNASLTPGWFTSSKTAGDNIDAGITLYNAVFETADTITAGIPYTFSVLIKDAADFDLNNHALMNASASATLTIAPAPVAVSSITLNKDAFGLTVGDSETLTATVNPKNATDKTVTWSSDNENAATVDANGKVTAVGEGEAIITATANDGSGVTASCKVTVTAKPVPVTAIALADAKVSVGSTVQLTPKFTPAGTTQTGLTWESSDETKATVDENGLVKGIAEGEVTITATSKENQSIKASCKVTVTKKDSTIVIPGEDGGAGVIAGGAIISGIGGDDLPFTDVSFRNYYYNAVKWAVDKGITSGTSRYTFSPDVACTRAQVVTFLWRAAGSPAPMLNKNPFTDVHTSDYYYDAVLWAVQNGITNGTSAKTFSPDATVTRAQVVTFLWRANGQPTAGNSGFVDVCSNAYYAKAVDWAFANGITTGMDYGAFGPDTACTRAQIVTFLYRAR